MFIRNWAEARDGNSSAAAIIFDGFIGFVLRSLKELFWS
jgi:hypothetical protein